MSSNLAQSLLLRFSALAFAVLAAFSAEGQNRPGTLDSGSVAQQFEYVIDESGRYQEYKVIKRVWIDALEDHVADTLKVLRQKINGDAREISDRDNQIESLQAELNGTKETLTKTESERDSIRFLGIPMSKGAYSSMVWGLVAVLLLVAGFLFTRTRAAVGEAAANRKMHDDLQEDYDAYKKRALEREQKLKRELQDELNKRSSS